MKSHECDADTGKTAGITSELHRYLCLRLHFVSLARLPLKGTLNNAAEVIGKICLHLLLASVRYSC